MTMSTMRDIRESDSGYALFRRAIAEHDAQDWEEIALLRRQLLIIWARPGAEALPEGETA
jgi:hypothetical protein